MTTRNEPTYRMVAFDPFDGGHHPEYLHALAQRWARGAGAGELVVACSSKTATDARLDELIRASPGLLSHLELGPMVPARARGRFGADWAHAQLLESVVQRVEPDDVLVMYLDRLLAPLATRLRFDGLPRLHGIYFRPSIHYRHIRSAPLTVGELARGRIRHGLLTAALRNASLTTVFSLDPLFTESIGGVHNRTRIVSVPDVAYGSTDRAACAARRAGWNIDPGRVTMLMFGVLAARKGIGTLCEALGLLPPAVQTRLAVVFCGRPLSAEKESIAELLGTVSRETAVQIVVDEDNLHFTEVQSAFDAADLVLVPYLRHIGSSAVLVRAAAAGKPVIASDFGLVGHYVRTQSLGRVVDTRDPLALHATLAEAVADPLEGFRADDALRFARRHGPDRMADMIIDSMSAAHTTHTAAAA